MTTKEAIEFMSYLSKFAELSQDHRIFVYNSILFFIVHENILLFLESSTKINI